MSRWAPWMGRPLGSGLARVLVGLAAAATVLGIALPAEAVPMVFTDRDAFLEAVGAVVTEDFEDTPLGLLPAGTTDIGLFDIVIDAPGTIRPAIIDMGNVNGSVEFNGTICEPGTCDTESIVFDFGGTIFGFAGDWWETTTTENLTITVNEETFLFRTELSDLKGTGFLGIVDPDGFTSVSFSIEDVIFSFNIGEVFSVDDVLLATTLPEPVPLVLLGLALSGLALPRRRGGA